MWHTGTNRGGTPSLMYTRAKSMAGITHAHFAFRRKKRYMAEAGRAKLVTATKRCVCVCARTWSQYATAYTTARQHFGLFTTQKLTSPSSHICRGYNTEAITMEAITMDTITI